MWNEIMETCGTSESCETSESPAKREEENREEKTLATEGCIKFLLYLGVLTVINICWQVLELLLYGAVRPDAVDTIIGLAFAWVAYKLLRTRCKINGR